tara:strand:+ start:753 stop:932 length:180 start_codon:yes stop_codon:yes gene_type:complete
MKIYLTEFEGNEDRMIGPIIKADSIDSADEIAEIYGLLIVCELQELKHKPKISLKRVVH